MGLNVEKDDRLPSGKACAGDPPQGGGGWNGGSFAARRWSREFPSEARRIAFLFERAKSEMGPN